MTKIRPEIQARLKELPKSPGVYQMLNHHGDIIYIGKAKVLKNRVNQYFTKNKSDHRAAYLMLPHIRNIEWIVTNSELEALILEAELIQKHQPKYNVRLKDDKHYPYLRLTLREAYPRLVVARKVLHNGDKFYGPYTNVRAMHKVREVIHNHFRIRDCSLKLPMEKGYRPCLSYHINKCDAPCDNLISQENYAELVGQVQQILSGRIKHVSEMLTQKMLNYSKLLKFEKASEVKEQIEALATISHRQRVDLREGAKTLDVVVLARKEEVVVFVVLEYRDGCLSDRKRMCFLAEEGESDEELLETFFLTHYAANSKRDILVEKEYKCLENIALALLRKTNINYNIVAPKIGEKKKIVELALSNARMLVTEEWIREGRKSELHSGLQDLQKELGLPRLPKYIAGFDISHLSGTNTVASMVVFRDGKPSKKDYRKFRIKTVEGINDFASMKEVVYRRFRRILEEKLEFPDLLLIDGGKGQVSSAGEALQELEVYSQPFIGIAKKIEELIIPGQEQPVLLPIDSPALKILRRVRDESHRFAITFQKNSRTKSLQPLHQLLEIRGIGVATYRKLVAKYGNITALKQANLSDLQKLIGVRQAKILQEELINLPGLPN